MCFNLGITRLLKFKKFLGAMEDHNWDKAAVEMLDSRWAIQVGPRAIRLKDRVLGA
jgi:lysozyme